MIQAHKDSKVRWVCRESQAHLDQMDQWGIKDLKAIQDPKVYLEGMEQLDQKVQREKRGNKEIEVFLGTLDFL